MIRVKVFPATAKWLAWQAKAKKAAAAAILEFTTSGTFVIRKSLYKECRSEIIDAFYKKCGYCEALVVASTVHLPDVEHYRPIGRVMEYPSRSIVRDKHKVAHTGYYWLAYDWRNLLASCPACNRPGKRTSLVGKWDFFPILGTRVFNPTNQIDDIELPLLLNPWQDEPNEHFVFDTKTGIIAPLTTRGSVTRDVLDLNREGLLTLRLQALKVAKLAIANYAHAAIAELPMATHCHELAMHEASKTQPFSAFRRACILPLLESIEKSLEASL